jgi:hypothetical protein
LETRLYAARQPHRSCNRLRCGGVAGRRGQKHQDHVAASYVIAMLSDPSIAQIECETADDVTIRRAAPGGGTDNEYVQVKTTENEDKWTATALLAREDGREGTSIAERSLACDTHPGEPTFRLVTNREPRGNLQEDAEREIGGRCELPDCQRVDREEVCVLQVAEWSNPRGLVRQTPVGGRTGSREACGP